MFLKSPARAADDRKMTGALADTVVSWTQVDGVNVAWGHAPGPLHASLMFRVGKADESLPCNGITHLVEHLTLFPLGQVPHYQNGSVRTTMTSFDTAGEPEQVVAFLSGVCAGLGRLPTERLEAEIRVVDTEAARRPNSTHTALLTWRFGASGPGLWGFDEYATRTVTPESLQLWADQVFTRENAVLVLTGPPPAGLTLPLASRGRLQPPPLVTVPPVLPAWFRHGFRDVAASTVVKRSVGALAYSYALQHRLTERLRYDLGLAYSPSVSYDPYDGELAHLVASADAHPDHVTAVAQVLADVVHELAVNGPTPAVLQEYIALSVQHRGVPGYAAGCAAYEAAQLLQSGTYRSTAESTVETDALTVTQVQEAAVAARATMLLGLPKDADVPEGWTRQAPEWSVVPPVEGSTLTRELSAEEQPGQLILGPDGLTRDFGDGKIVTTRYAETAAVLTRPDGQRVLIARDALSIILEPRLWREGFAAVAQIDAATSHMTVPMPARDADAIPSVSRAHSPTDQRQKPKLASPTPAPAPARNPDHHRAIVMIGLGVLLLGVVFALSSIAGGHFEPSSLFLVTVGAATMGRNNRNSKP